MTAVWTTIRLAVSSYNMADHTSVLQYACTSLIYTVQWLPAEVAVVRSQILIAGVTVSVRKQVTAVQTMTACVVC